MTQDFYCDEVLSGNRGHSQNAHSVFAHNIIIFLSVNCSFVAGIIGLYFQ